MKNFLKSNRRTNILDMGFYGGLAIKAVNALVEFIGGFIMIILNHERLNSLIRLISIPELREDPNDFMMNYIIKIGQNLSVSSQYSIAIYMLLHGFTKLAVIWLLWKKKLWAYIPGAAVFGFFVAYEIYSFMYSRSVVMFIITIIDIAIVLMVVLEYKRFKTKR